MITYTAEEIKIANKTSRASGAVSGNAIVPRFVSVFCNKTDTILDFGAGHAAIHSKKLKLQGFDEVTAYDFGNNLDENLHDRFALNKKYEVVFASNVLNVQSSVEMLRNTLTQIKSVMLVESIFIANLPLAPRKFSELNSELLVNELSKKFSNIEFYKIDKLEITKIDNYKNPSTIFKISGI